MTSPVSRKPAAADAARTPPPPRPRVCQPSRRLHRWHQTTGSRSGKSARVRRGKQTAWRRGHAAVRFTCVVCVAVDSGGWSPRRARGVVSSPARRPTAAALLVSACASRRGHPGGWHDQVANIRRDFGLALCRSAIRNAHSLVCQRGSPDAGFANTSHAPAATRTPGRPRAHPSSVLRPCITVARTDHSLFCQRYSLNAALANASPTPATTLTPGRPRTHPSALPQRLPWVTPVPHRLATANVTAVTSARAGTCPTSAG